VVDTTVQPKPALAKAEGDRPSDRCAVMPRGLEKLVDLARRHHVPLRQS
jgi:hypothetical protein